MAAPFFLKDVKQHAFWDNNLFGVIIADESGNYVDANTEVSRMTGYNVDELKGMNVLSLIDPLYKQVAETHFMQLGSAGNASDEVPYYTKSGEKRWWNVVATRLSDGYLLGLHQDITNRKMIEDANIQREEHLRKQNQALLALVSGGKLFQSDLQEAISEITETCSKLVNTERVSVWLYFDEFSGIRCINLYNGTRHQHENQREILYCRDFPNYFDCQKKGEVIDAVNVFTDPRTSELSAGYYREHNIHSMLDTPVWFHDRLGGVLCFEHTGEQRVWTSEDLRLATSMAALLSLCFQNEERRQAESERRQIQNNLEEKEEQYRLLAENSQDLIYVYNLLPEPHYEYISPSCYQLTGYRPEDGYADPFTYHKFINTPAGIEKFSQFLMDPAQPTVIEEEWKRSDGTWIWVEQVVSRKFDNTGKLVSFQSTVRDITERKLAEAEINASEKKFRELSTMMRLMTDNMPDMLWAKNLNKEFIFTNKAICKNLLGAVDTDEPVGKTDMFFALRQRNSQPDNPQWHTFGEICSDSDSITLKELKPMQFDEFGNVKGKFLFLDVHKAPLYDEQGQLIGVVGSARDITERKALEENLIQQTRLRELLMEISSGFINIPLDKVEVSINEALIKMGRFVNADRSYTFDYDWEKDECNNIYEWCEEGISPEIGNLQHVPLAMMQDWVDAHKKGEPMYVTDVLALPRGAVREIIEPQGIKSVLTVPMMDRRQCIGFVGFDSVRKHHVYSQAEMHLLRLFAQSVTNVKLRQAMEEQLVNAKEQAEESDRLKSAFLANMSHEIRTPMNGIIGFAELLKEPNLTGEEQKEYIAIIEKSGQRMLNIINDIIDISKIEAGLMEVKMSDTNINDQIEYVHTFFKPEATNKGISFSVHTSLTRQEAVIFTDREKVYAILTNLVKNAIKFTHKGQVEVGCARKGQVLEFYVKDTGIGIPGERQTAIFKRFIQADIEDRMAYQGAGLGLSITKAYLEMIGGKIWVESEVGKGSTFYFTLPYKSSLTQGDSGQSSEKDETREETRRLKILVVEDDLISEMLFDAILKSFSEKIFKARTGVDALEVLLSNPDIDLILMDISLPGMDGYEVTRQIRKLNTDVVIVAQTAFGLSGDREKALEAGCTDYLAKPVNIKALNNLIKKHFG